MADYIDRQAAIDALGEEPERWTDTDAEVAEWLRWKADVTAIKFVPPADVRPVVHSEWMMNDNRTWSCKRCKSWIPDEQRYYANYCLCCGAEMDGGDAT